MSRAVEFLNQLNEKEEVKDPKSKEVPMKEQTKKSEPKQEVELEDPNARTLDKEIEQELVALFAQKSPNFEKVYEKIVKIIERRPMTQRAEIYKQLLNTLLKGIIGPAMINRQLFNGARDFWRNLVSGVFYK